MSVAGWTTRSVLDRYTGASADINKAAEARGPGIWREYRAEQTRLRVNRLTARVGLPMPARARSWRHYGSTDAGPLLPGVRPMA